jgi:hypothetical protein
VCVCSLSYPAHSAQAPHYTVICGLSGSAMFFPRYLTISLSHDFWYKLRNNFSLQILPDTFLVLRRIRPDIINKCLQALRVKKIRYSCRILMKSSVFSSDFRKILKYKMSRKSVEWKPSCSMPTDGQTDMAKLAVRFSQFCKRA